MSHCVRINDKFTGNCYCNCALRSPNFIEKLVSNIVTLMWDKDRGRMFSLHVGACSITKKVDKLAFLTNILQFQKCIYHKHLHF